MRDQGAKIEGSEDADDRVEEDEEGYNMKIT